MNLIYIYFDYTNKGENPSGYRGYQKCELNFGTDFYYSLKEPVSDEDIYRLQRRERGAGEKLENGFWGDERIYNISVLVGDNGVGKSTLIHEIIKNLLSLYNKSGTPLYPSVLLMQDDKGKLYLFHTVLHIGIDNFELDDTNIFLFGQENTANVLQYTKLIYLSNALTMADKNQYYNHVRLEPFKYQTNIDNVYTSSYTYPLYDCSLVADMADAIRNSKIGDEPIERYLDTYFNFKSYQEARYVFDRNQRKTLNEMKKKGYPVPIPKELKIEIVPAISRLRLLTRKDDSHKSAINGFEEWVNQYNRFVDKQKDITVLLTELSLNCIANFLCYVVEYEGKYVIESMLLPHNYEQKNEYIYCLKSIKSKQCRRNDRQDEIEQYYSICSSYIEFLWNNMNHFRKYFIPYVDAVYIVIKSQRTRHIDCVINFDNEMDIELEELMIRFINLNRAVSRWDYFVIFNWGLSSGEVNLLHMFTKLSYLLQGNSVAPLSA